MGYNQNLNLEQRLTQSPLMVQAMHILQLNSTELLDFLTAELEENPFLEVDDERPVSNNDNQQEVTDDSDQRDDADLNEYDTAGNLLEAAPNIREKGQTEASDFDFIQNTAAPDQQSADEILSELRTRDISEQHVRAAEVILTFLDDRGFLVEGISELSEMTGIEYSVLEYSLELIREVSHPALGAIDLRECFLLQLDNLEEEHADARVILTNHFDDLLANRLPQIAKAEKMTVEQVRHGITVLSLFDLRPFAAYTVDTNGVICPDVKIELDDDATKTPVVSLVTDYLPQISLSTIAHQALQDAKSNKKLHAHLLRKIDKARGCIDAIQQRRKTILSIAEVLAEKQVMYLKLGKQYLSPLIMQDVADQVGVHISTVSRAIRGKYAHTPQGVIALKSMFSGGQKTTTGASRTRASIQQRIEDIISAEDKAHPLSDEEVLRILKERDGVSVARRTITKYRKLLNIPSSSIRRKHS
ncbi:MAG: RNA polymerase factor sigma-54 [Planctomycetes bacterium]|nr:RNA polymerase factor sigma-54 [Planctomycetota bacterium]